MKKMTMAIVILFVAGLAFASCKSHQTCPAYGQVEVEPSNEQPA